MPRGGWINTSPVIDVLGFRLGRGVQTSYLDARPPTGRVTGRRALLFANGERDVFEDVHRAVIEVEILHSGFLDLGTRWQHAGLGHHLICLRKRARIKIASPFIASVMPSNTRPAAAAFV